MSPKRNMGTHLERGLYASRWLMAPMYAGLVIALGMLLAVFVRDIIYYVPQVWTMTVERSILVVLTFIDLTLVANLLVIVLFSGYENFIAKFNIDESEDTPSWMGTVDFSSLKMKVIASIVAISAISLLKRFMEIGEPDMNGQFGETELMWLVIIHLTFVASGVLMALMDFLISKSDQH